MKIEEDDIEEFEEETPKQKKQLKIQPTPSRKKLQESFDEEIEEDDDFPSEESEESEEPSKPANKSTESQPQYIAVPRAVPMETMLNEIYDSIQEILRRLPTK